MMMTPKGNMDSKDVTLAYDDDAKVKIGLGTREVTLAYNDVIKRDTVLRMSH